MIAQRNDDATTMSGMLHGPLFERPFFYLRHGETETNRLGLITGATDIELNARGREQALAAAELVRGLRVDAIYSSPLRRARDTAECVARIVGVPVILVPGIAERGFGELEGKPRRLLVRETTPPGGESLAAFTARVLEALAAIAGGNRPLVVAHSGVFRVLCEHLRIAARRTPIDNALPLLLSPPEAARRHWLLEHAVAPRASDSR
jgi:probable phosphoglycerate mutase